MKIEKQQREDGLYYFVSEHRAYVFTYKMEDETLEQKLKFVDEFLNDVHASYKKYTRKDVLLAFSKSDDEIKEYYKAEYPRGGSRKNAGRKQGSVQKTPKTDRTERFTMAITQSEKDLLTQTLENYRKTKEKSEEEIKKALAPIFRRIDESFGDDEKGRNKWRKRFGNINPALFPQLLEYILIFGIDKILPQEKKNDSLTVQHGKHLYSYGVSHEQKHGG